MARIKHRGKSLSGDFRPLTTVEHRAPVEAQNSTLVWGDWCPILYPAEARR
jgi:hypothetical protein